MSSIWYTKDPDEVKDYTLDYSGEMDSTDYIISSTWVFPDGLTKDSDTYTTTEVTVWVSGGTNQTTYFVYNQSQTANGRTLESDVTFYIREAPTVLSRLLPRLRLQLGDTDSATYRYLDDWLLVALQMAVETLQRWWNYKYLINYDTQEVERNPNYTYTQTSPPVIEDGDIRPIILMASIIIKEGSLQNNSWNTGSWRDAEIAYSNIEGNRSQEGSLGRDWAELTSILKPPVKRLAQPRKGSLPGYKDNTYERLTEY